MKVGELLQKKGKGPIYTTITTKLVSEADDLMKRYKIRSLLVLDGENRLWGIVTRTDIDWKVNLEGRDPTNTRVGEIMTPVEKTVTVDVESP